MRQVFVVGIGTGDPDHLTFQAAKLLARADVVFIPLKGEEKQALADLRREIMRRHGHPGQRVVEFALPRRRTEGIGYAEGVAEWHAAIARLYASLLREHLGEDRAGAFLVWGDPMLYDSTLRILDRVRALNAVPFAVTIVPGITSIQALAASHAIPLNAIGQPVTITTGRRLRESFPDPAGTAVVMLDGEQAFLNLDDPETTIYWGAYLGLPQEVVIAGKLGAVKDRIVETRAALRAEHGWIMDIYLLHRAEAEAADEA
ncbi:precorrin-6A synthase (deacetylating) [Rhizobium sp. YIM 134829]|uniref:precorrin-6A synthase (deacetylating) n=1 Tax=Rhizobium sp. YIM 134829 TaxID=3390453 RepID=UPI0039799989